MKKLILGLISLLGALTLGAQAQQYWRIDGTSATWTGSNWSNTGSSPFTTTWTSGSNAVFNANSTVTFATTTIGNITLADGVTVTVGQAGTLSTGAAARTINVGTGSLLDWATQNVSTSASNAGFIKTGAGTWNIGAQGNAYNATNFGFTLNAGTVIVGGNNAFGGTSSLLTLNGGNIQSSGTRAYANSITVGGDFTNSGTGNATFSGTVALGSAARTITNTTTSGSRIYSGLISSGASSGLNFAGTGAGQTYIGNSSNTFTGAITITGSEVGFANNGALGNASNTIVIDGGRFSAASTSGASVTYTLASTHGIQIGSTDGTSISTVSGGVLTYDGVISDKSGSTGSWAKQGSGTLALGGISTYTGNTAINNGTLQLTTGNDRLPTGTVVSLGQAASANLGTLDLNSRNQTIAGLNSTTGSASASTNTGSNNTVTSSGAATFTINGSGSYSFGAATDANSGVITGAIALVKDGTGTQTLGDNNTYTGGTTVNNGTLQIGKDNALLTTGALTVNGGTFGLQSFNQTVGAFSQTGGDVTGTGTLTVSSFSSTGGNVSAKIAGTGATFSKNTTGTTTVTGTQAYTGATSVTSGTLVVNGDISSSSGVAVSSGATLGGSGKVGGISGAGTVGPGNSPGIMTASSVDLSTGLDFKFELTTATPTYSNATGSLNDVLHLNNVSTPISGTAGAGNIFDIYLGVATLTSQDFVGGIFTDKSSDFSLLVLSGTYNYYVLGNGSGTHAYNGSSYYTLGEYNTLLGAAWTVTASVAQVASANFADGTITNGFEQKFTTVVPEPSTYAMLVAGVLMLFVVVRRPRSGMA